MKRKFLVMLVMVLAVGAQAQDFKIGYVNLDAIVFNMPEMEGIRSELDTYEKQLQNQVASKRNTLQQKVQEYELLAQNPGADQTALKERENELNKLNQELQVFAQQADQAFQGKQGSLMNPVYAKVQAAIEEVRKENGYSMVLNSQIIGAGSIVIAAEESDNLVEKIYAKLGLPMPQTPAEGDTTGTGGN
jgi:outer membrane protein